MSADIGAAPSQGTSHGDEASGSNAVASVETTENVASTQGDELAFATRSNNLDKVTAICASTYEALRDSSGHTALHWAALGASVHTLTLLLKLTRHSVDVRSEASEQYGQTPLHWALVAGSSANVAALLQAGASPARSDARGYTSLIHCAQYGRVDLAHLLLLADASLINVPDREGRTALHWAAHGGHYAIVAYLLRIASPSADVSYRDSGGQTALHKACARCHGLVVRTLLEAGAPHNSMDDENRTPQECIPSLRSAQSVRAELRRAERYEISKPPRSQLRSYFLVFFYYAILVLSYWFYVRYVEWLAPRATLYGGALRAFSLVALVAHAFATYGDAGDLKKGTPSSCRRDIERAIALDQGEIALGPARYCFSCLRPRIPRSKHSRSRAACVRRFDHECPWTNNAVGLRNHRILLVFAAAMFATQVLFLDQLRVALMHDKAIHIWWDVLYKRPLAVFLFVLHLGLATFCIVLLVQHVLLAARGLTTYEQIAYKRNNRRNPYDRGYARNLWFFITGRGPGTEEDMHTIEPKHQNLPKHESPPLLDSVEIDSSTGRTESLPISQRTTTLD